MVLRVADAPILEQIRALHRDPVGQARSSSVCRAQRSTSSRTPIPTLRKKVRTSSYGFGPEGNPLTKTPPPSYVGGSSSCVNRKTAQMRVQKLQLHPPLHFAKTKSNHAAGMKTLSYRPARHALSGGARTLSPPRARSLSAAPWCRTFDYQSREEGECRKTRSMRPCSYANTSLDSVATPCFACVVSFALFTLCRLYVGAVPQNAHAIG